MSENENKESHVYLVIGQDSWGEYEYNEAVFLDESSAKEYAARKNLDQDDFKYHVESCVLSPKFPCIPRVVHATGWLENGRMEQYWVDMDWDDDKESIEFEAEDLTDTVRYDAILRTSSYTSAKTVHEMIRKRIMDEFDKWDREQGKESEQ